MNITNGSAYYYTPHIIHFEESFSELEISASEDILWPCFAWKTAIPVRSASRLNPFEELVLRLSVQGLRHAEAIANFCYPAQSGNAHPHTDIFSCAQSRLAIKGFLDNRFEITNSGKNLLDTWENEKIEYVSALVYQDKINGGFLPFVNFASPEYAEIIEKRNRKITFKRNTTDRGCHAQVIDTGLLNPQQPSGDDVMRILSEFSLRFKRYALLRKTTMPLPLYDTSALPTVQAEPEFVYLHCHILVRPGFSDFLISDGFGLGYSASFANFISAQNWEWLTELKKKALIDSSSFTSRKSLQVSPVLSGLNTTEKVIQRWKDKPPASPAEGKKKKKNIQDALTRLYDALEHTFAVLCFQYPAQEWVDFLSNGQYGHNKKLIEESARMLGFTVTEENSFVLNVPPGSIRATQNGVIELSSFLVISIISARHDNIHPCNVLAREFPDFLDFANEFTKRRNPLKHGDYSQSIDIDDLEQYFIKCKKATGILFPKGLPKNQRNYIATLYDDEILSDYGQLRLRAEVAVEEYFKRYLFDSMDSNLREILCRLEMPQYDFIVTIVDSASALQIALHSLTVRYGDTSKSEFAEWMDGFASELTAGNTAVELKRYTLERAIQFGLLPVGSDLPVTISSVNESRIYAALRGGKISLQAQCLALLAVGSNKVLDIILKEIPDLISFVDSVVQMRGHGNTANTDEKAIKKLQETLFDTIKKLLEVTVWQK